MSDSPSHGQPSNGSSPNGHSGSDLNGLMPRLAPPEGARAARGQTFSESEETSKNETSETEMNDAATRGIETDSDPTPPLGLDIEDDTMISSAEMEKRGDEADRYRVGKRDDTPNDKELGLFEHLTELRQRLLNCIIAVVVAMCLTWNFREPLQEWFARPIRQVLLASKVPNTPGVPVTNQQVNTIASTDPTGFFAIAFQFSMVSALILVMPFLFYQIWRFIEPALTHSERRYTLILVPFSSILFFVGAGLGFAVSPLFFQFFIGFQPPGVSAVWDYYQCISLMAKMLLVFGLAFQVPIITIFLAKVGLVTRNILIEYWRHAVVVIFTLVAIATPTWDPMTLTVCALPPCLLYVLSIWLVKWL
jgi:sec-independent protein translocase protein TatC